MKKAVKNLVSVTLARESYKLEKYKYYPKGEKIRYPGIFFGYSVKYDEDAWGIPGSEICLVFRSEFEEYGYREDENHNLWKKALVGYRTAEGEEGSFYVDTTEEAEAIFERLKREYDLLEITYVPEE